MSDYRNLAEAFLHQGEFCQRSNSPFDFQILQKSAELIQQDSQSAQIIQRLFKQWANESNQGVLTDQAVAIRWIAAWHYLVLNQVDKELTAAFPGPSNEWHGDFPRFWSSMMRLLSSEDHQATIHSFMQKEPQTNEVNRCILFLPGFLLLAQRFSGKPLRCFELGASAGLISIWPQYHYTLSNPTTNSNESPIEWGEKNSKVRLSTEWQGHSFPRSLVSASVTVSSVKCCDHEPINLADDAQVQRLRSYIWSDQRERMERIIAAIETARQIGTVRVEKADAAAWTEENVQLQTGTVTVLYHSYLWQYLPAGTRERINNHMQALAKKASFDSPLAWLTVEALNDEGYVGGSGVKLRMWPPEGEELRLAECHPHGKWIKLIDLEDNSKH